MSSHPRRSRFPLQAEPSKNDSKMVQTNYNPSSHSDELESQGIAQQSGTLSQRGVFRKILKFLFGLRTPVEGPSFFRSARNIVINGGNFSIIEHKRFSASREFNASSESLYKIRREDLILLDEVYVREDGSYRIHSARRSGQVVAIQVYTGNLSKERCLGAARFYRNLTHPFIPFLSGISSNILVFNEVFDGTLVDVLQQALHQGEKEGLALGAQTVMSFSSAFDYLQGLDFPLASIEPHQFVPMVSNRKIVISFDIDEVELRQNFGLNTEDALRTFHALCQMTFDAARKVHYEILTPDDPTESDHGPQGSLPSERLHSDERRAVPPLAARRLSASSSSSMLDTSLQEPSIVSNELSIVQSRQEVVWKPSSDKSLREISHDYKALLKEVSSSLDYAVPRRQDLSPAKSGHRCPGYNRIEIRLAPDTRRSEIISHATPTLDEICLVCKEVVKPTNRGHIFIYSSSRLWLEAIFPPEIQKLLSATVVGKRELCDLELTLLQGRVYFDRYTDVVTAWLGSRMRYNVDAGDITTIRGVVKASLHFYYHLSRTAPTTFDNVSMELKELSQEDDLDITFPIGENLLKNEPAKIVVNEEAQLGMSIYNGSSQSLYPYLFYFDPMELTIVFWYMPSGPKDILPPQSELTIGYGDSSDTPWQFVIPNGESLDIGFLKLFLSTQPACFEFISQELTPFTTGTTGRVPVWPSRQSESIDKIANWAVQTATVVQLAGPKH